MIATLRLIRFPNLLIMALTQFLVRHALILNYDIPHALNDFQFALLVLATICIAGAGYVINDYFDVKVDLINHAEDVVVGKSISRTHAITLHLVLTSIGVGLGVYLAYAVGMLSLSIIQIASAGLLWFYSTTYKRQFLIGNLVVAFLTALVVLSVGIFEIVPALNENSFQNMKNIFFIITGYATFAFLGTWIREIIKDMIQLKGDTALGYKTLAITWGDRKAKSFALALILVLLLLILYFTYAILAEYPYHLVYVTLTVILPTIYLLYQVSVAKVKKDYLRANTLMKVVLLFGALSMLAFQLITMWDYAATA